ncbi:FAD/NAD(P)-binding protein, partial [Candidatus Binatia bacterium]|nr:FAD/NAD(P)-binding protein [Candidatus Binatia bacterium]
MPLAIPGCRAATVPVRSVLGSDVPAAPTVAIVGGGFSGVMVAAHLLRAACERCAPLRVALIEKSPGFEGGAAYRTDSSRHVLNVPCARMGAYADDPEHFLRWLRTRDPDIRGDAYVPRALYREYLRTVLDEAVAAASGIATLDWIAGEAADVIEAPYAEGARVVLEDGRAIDASSVVLAIGNLPPGHPGPADRLRDSAFYVRDPWRGPPAIERDEPVLLIGTGLTMLDYALALDERGHRGSIIAVSRHGLVPEGHADAAREALPESERQRIVVRSLLAAGVERQSTAR